MRLSEAMMLGSTTCKMVANNMGSCALGAACNALGIPLVVNEEWRRYSLLRDSYPWIESKKFTNHEGSLQYDGTTAIYTRFDDYVCQGKMTFEQLVDYVRSIEPTCDCNRFNCDCDRQPPIGSDVPERIWSEVA